MRFIIAYDIAHPRRLRRVARVMEKHAIRCQKSVFIAQTDIAGVAAIVVGALILNIGIAILPQSSKTASSSDPAYQMVVEDLLQSGQKSFHCKEQSKTALRC